MYPLYVYTYTGYAYTYTGYPLYVYRVHGFIQILFVYKYTPHISTYVYMVHGCMCHMRRRIHVHRSNVLSPLRKASH